MTRANRFFEKQMEDKKLKALVEEELEVLRIGAKIAALRDEAGLTQTKLAARAGMPSSKISALENSPHNLEIATLVRIARAANRELKITFTPKSSSKMAKPTRDQKSKVQRRSVSKKGRLQGARPLPSPARTGLARVSANT